jgi:hypothetical protein
MGARWMGIAALARGGITMQKLSRAAMLLLFVAAAASAQEKPGSAITSGVGLAETTAQIMARQATTNVIAQPRLQPRLRPTLQRQFNPDTLPDQTAAPMAKSLSGSLKIAQTYSTSWLGADLFDAKAFPPDSMGAIGPSQYIVAINGRIRTFDRKGLVDPTLDVDTDVFFASAMTPIGGGVTSNFTSDPRIRYDRITQRWYIVMIDVPNNGTSFFANRVMIAVSDTPQISSTTIWRFFYFNPTANFVDYPTLGVDNNALYIGANIFNLPGTAYINADGYVVRKSTILGAGPATVTVFSNLIGDPVGCSSDGPYTPQGVDNANSATEGYFIGVSFCFFSRLIVRRVVNPGSASPTISGNLQVLTAPFTVAYTQPHLGNTGGTNGELDASDTRLMSAQVRNGNLYTAHAITVKPDGTAVGFPAFDATGRNALRWYRINGLTTGPAVADFGTVYDNTATDPHTTNVRWFSYPGIQVTGQNHMAIGFTASGPLQRANAGFTGRLATDAPGVTDAPTIYTNALQAYNPPSDPGGTFGRRWGDYSYTSVDPNDDMTMYTIQEYTSALDTWGVRVTRLNAPGPAQPTAINTPTVPTGTASTTVQITGTSSGGSGFFDPGPGFDSRIAVEILPGVTVTAVQVVDPTHLNVTFSTVGASVGEKVIRVINPDGQVATQSATLLTVTGTAAPFFNSANSFICAVGSPCNFTFTTGNGPTSPTTFSIAGVLPTGVNFATPSLSGTPAAGTQGTYTLTVTANNGTAPNATQTFTLIVTAPCGGFTDVTVGASFCNSAEWLKNRGVTLGCTATTYCPNDTVTRAQMALFMQRLGDAISPAIYSDNVISTGALNVDNRPYVCTTPAFPPMNYPRVALLSWMFDGYADNALDVRVYSRTTFDNQGTYTTNELNLPRIRVNDRVWGNVSAHVKVNIPAGSSPRFALRMDRINGSFSGNFSAGLCNISVLMTSVNGGASPYDGPTQPQEPTPP